MSDAEIFREVDEDYRRDRMIAFWRRYGTIVLMVMIAAMLASAGLNYYIARQNAEKAAQTEKFEALLSSIKPDNEADSIVALSAFAAQANPAQATLAMFTEAALRQRSGNLTAAAQVYHRIADGTLASEDMRDLAVVRLGYIAADTPKPEPMVPRLEAIVAKNSPWRYSAREAIALLKARAGDYAGATKMLSDLARDTGAPPDLAGRAHALAELYRGK